MKNSFLLLLLFTAMAKAQTVTIPDANFKAKLLAIGVDTNSDGIIETTEAISVTTLDISGASILNLTGINAFTNITNLNCSNNLLTSVSINISNLTTLNLYNNLLNTLSILSPASLTSLNIGKNNLAVFDASAFTNLTDLDCYQNHISSLDCTALVNLVNLNCMGNTMTDLQLGNLSNLKILYCQTNNLSQINVSGLTSLEQFYCSSNQLTTLDVYPLVNLQTFNCNYNLMTTLDVSHNPHLCLFSCVGMSALTSINMKDGSISCLSNKIMYQNPNLQYVCADTEEIAFLQSYFNSNSMSYVQVGYYCSFAPGGNYNTITGNVKDDADSNGCDSGDADFPNIRVNINDGINPGAFFTNANGNYTYYVDQGTFDVVPSLENAAWFNISPNPATIPFPDNNNNTLIQNFCISPNGIHQDLEIVISPITQAQPGSTAEYRITCKNIGNQIMAGNFSFHFNDDVLDFISATATPDSQGTGTLGWNYSNLYPFEERHLDVTLHVNTSTDTPPVNIGDNLLFSATIFPIATDENTTDNDFNYNQTVVDSFDPNDITCLEGNVVAVSEIGNYLHYAINFENTGTDVAQNIVVKMQIDPAQFNLNSLQILNASHPMEAKITGDIVEFVFKNIDLNIGGHGHILLKLKSNASLSVGSIVSRRADIFFDYNFPVDTGLANTTFQVLKTQDFQIDSSVAIYPNPTAGMLTIKSDHALKTVSVYDVQGRILATHLAVNSETTIDLSRYPKGIYFVKVATDAGTKTEKIIRE